MLWRRRDPQTQAPRKAEGGQKADAPVRQSRNPAIRLHRRPQNGRRLSAQGPGVGLPKTARIKEPRTICPAHAEHYGILAIIGSLRTEGGSAIAQQLSPEQPNVRFGVDENQVRHTFRHTDQLGLDRDAVSNAIRTDLARQGPASPGANITGNISVGGVTID